MVNQYQVSNYESAQIVDEKIDGTTILKAKVAIPKFMTNMRMGDYETTKSIDNNLFVNDKRCLPKVNKTIKCRGYVTLEKYGTEVINLNNKALKDNDGKLYIPKGTSIVVEVSYEDTLNMHIIERE